MSKKRSLEEKKIIKPKPRNNEDSKQQTAGDDVSNLQKILGNRTVQRLLTQRKEVGQTQLDEETASRINQERGGGKPLEEGFQDAMEASFGHDLSGVRIHSSPEADTLNEEMGAKAFTTGKDIFFRQDAYDPNTSAGQKLIAHELTHVVQQGTGAVSHEGSGMMINAPGDTFEQEADAISQKVNNTQATSDVQRQEEDEEIQTQPLEEEDEEVQTQPLEEEEEELQRQEEEEEEEEEEALQMQEDEEYELI